MAIIRFVLFLALFAGQSVSLHDRASTIRAPAYPLAVRQPYSSFWLNGNTLPGHWPIFWNTFTKRWTGIVRVDNQSFAYLGNPKEGLMGDIQVAIQKASYITPTQTVFEIQAGPIDLTVTFNSPVEFENVEKQSIPLSYVFITAKSNDGASHSVQVYMDITAEWASCDLKKVAKWDINNVNGLKIWTTELVDQIQFAEHIDYAEWGQAVIVTTNGASHMSGHDAVVWRQFVDHGVLDNSTDPDFRCIECDWPVIGFAHDLGKVDTSVSKELTFVVGHIRENNINLMGVPQRALWTHYYETKENMITKFFNDVTHAKELAEQVDRRTLDAAFTVGGQDYCDIVSLSLRQAYAGTEFSGNITHPVLYQKEISSNGNMQTVDVMFPAIPMFYFYNVKYLEYLLEPLFFQMENGLWPKDFSMHDIGFHYPNATGHPDGEEEDMPVEESANMILMVADIVLNPHYENGPAYIQKHYRLLSQWAEYLYNNCLYPVDQLTTDDFIGPTQLNSGLALKGILGMKAFAKLSELVGETNATSFYNDAVDKYIDVWVNESMHTSGTHLKMEYNVTEGYQFKYNAFHDKLLNLSVVPEHVYEMEAAFYLTKQETYGTPFVGTHDYTKSDWEMWTASAFGDVNPTLKEQFIKNIAKYLRDTPSRVPFSDWYTTGTGYTVAFLARPVVGGHFSLLARSPYV